MSIIFEIDDKTGRKIHLTKERWTHITSPSSLHAYMTNYLEEIKQTLTQPYKILTSSIEDKKVNYYRYFKEKNSYLKAIVKYLNGKGFYFSTVYKHNKMNGQMSIYYDEEGDYLELYIAGASPTRGEEIDEDITIFRSEETNDIVGIGILNFKKRTKSLQDIKLNLPFAVNFSSLKL